MKWGRILKTIGIGAGVAAACFGLTFLGAIPAMGSVAAQVISSIGAVGTVAGYATVGVGGVAAAGKGLVNLAKYAFNKNYRNQVRKRAEERRQQRKRKAERKQQNNTNQNSQEKQPNIFKRALNTIGNFFKRLFRRNTEPQQVTQPNQTVTEDEVVDVDEELKNENVQKVEQELDETLDNTNENVQKVEQELDETLDEVNENVHKEVVTKDEEIVNVNDENNNEIIDAEIIEKKDPVEEEITFVEPVPETVQETTKKPTTKAGGMYDSMGDDNKLLYDTISGKTFTTIFAKMTHDQFHEYLEILKDDVAKIKTKDPSTLTRTDVQTLALVDKMVKAKHHKVQVEGKKRYAPTKKESKGLTEEEIKYKSDSLALDALLERTDVTEQDIENQRKKNASKGR